jgi:uroporphyrinogen decarboxylase
VGWTDADGEVFPTGPAVGSYEDVEAVPVPDPDAPGRFEELAALEASPEREKFFLGVGHPYFLYEKAINILGPEEFGVAMLAAPEKAHLLLDRILAFELGIAERYLKAARVEQVNFSDDYGHQDRLAMSPECWRTFFKPRLARAVRFYRERLGPGTVVSLHSCGHVMPILEDLIEAGIDVLHPVQSTANDLVELRRRTSRRLVLCGGICGQHVLPLGTPEEVRAEVFRKLDLLWEGGGYLPLPEKMLGVSEANLRAMEEAIRDWSRANVESG